MIVGLLCSSGLGANHAQAQTVSRLSRASISIPAGSLSDALIALATQTGASIGLPERLPGLRVPALRGTMDLAEAFRRILKNTDFEARQTGPQAWRIVSKPHKATEPRTPQPPRLQSTPRPAAAPDVPSPDIVVTASKTGDSLRSLPLSAHIVGSSALLRFGAVPTTGAIAQIEDGLVLSNLGPGRNKAYLRGISDSPFNGVSQSTVTIEIDDARVTFNAPDPELRLVDIDRVELLEGPQGPMHGTGALGGVYRILPRVARADATQAVVSLGVDGVTHGGIGQSGSAMLNLPLARDALALRVVAYGANEAGWIERDGANGHDSNSSVMSGARANLRWLPAVDWSVDLSGALQMLHVRDSQYVDAGSNLFERTGSLAEPHDNDFINARLAVNGKLGEADLLSTTSWTSHEVTSALDASSAAGVFGQSGSVLFEDSRQYEVRSQEVRLSGGHKVRWIGGLSYLRATTTLDAVVTALAGGGVVQVGGLRQKNAELAAFGQISFPLLSRVRMDAGARMFRTVTEDDIAGPGRATSRSTRRLNVSPSASLGWTINDRAFAYARFASAFRPAGLSPFAPVGQEGFESDELQSAEIGGRLTSRDARLKLNANGYFANWSHVQSDYLLPNGLVATRNSGTGVIYGVATDVQWNNGPFRLGAGLSVQHAKLEKPDPNLPLPNDLSLPVVPAVKGHLNAGLAGDLGRGAYNLGGSLSFIGATRLSLDPALNRRIGARTSLDLDASYSVDNWSFAVRLENALNTKADTFGYGNPFSIQSVRQITPQKPRAIGLTVTRAWN